MNNAADFNLTWSSIPPDNVGRQHTLNPIATLGQTPLGIASTATTPLEAFTPVT